MRALALQFYRDLHLFLGEEEDATIVGSGRLHDLDGDDCSTGELGWAGVEGDGDGVEHVEMAQQRGGMAGGAHQALHGAGRAEQVGDLRLYEGAAGLEITPDDDVVDADADGLGVQATEDGLHLLLVRRSRRRPVQLLGIVLLLVEVDPIVLATVRLVGSLAGLVRRLVGSRVRGLLGGGIRGDRHGWGFGRKVEMESRTRCGEGLEAYVSIGPGQSIRGPLLQYYYCSTTIESWLTGKDAAEEVGRGMVLRNSKPGGGGTNTSQAIL